MVQLYHTPASRMHTDSSAMLTVHDLLCPGARAPPRDAAPTLAHVSLQTTEAGDGRRGPVRDAARVGERDRWAVERLAVGGDAVVDGGEVKPEALGAGVGVVRDHGVRLVWHSRAPRPAARGPWRALSIRFDSGARTCRPRHARTLAQHKVEPVLHVGVHLLHAQLQDVATALGLAVCGARVPARPRRTARLLTQRARARTAAVTMAYACT